LFASEQLKKTKRNSFCLMYMLMRAAPRLVPSSTCTVNLHTRTHTQYKPHTR
jgi:hypothetical protein